jgi:hypothetical protein
VTDLRLHWAKINYWIFIFSSFSAFAAENLIYTFRNPDGSTGNIETAFELPFCSKSIHPVNTLIRLSEGTALYSGLCVEEMQPFTAWGSAKTEDGERLFSYIYLDQGKDNVAREMESRRKGRDLGLSNHFDYVNGNSEGDCPNGTIATVKISGFQGPKQSVLGYCLEYSLNSKSRSEY